MDEQQSLYTVKKIDWNSDKVYAAADFSDTLQFSDEFFWTFGKTIPMIKSDCLKFLSDMQIWKFRKNIFKFLENFLQCIKYKT